MNTQAPSFNIAGLAERMAWMHDPVDLSHVRMPWFLRWYYEQAVHRMFCTLERMLLALMERQAQGTLPLSPAESEPEPEPAAEAETAPRRSRYKMKFPPVAPARDAGCSAVPLSPQMASAPAPAPAMAAVMETAAASEGETAEMAGTARGGLALAARPALVPRAARIHRRNRPMAQAWGGVRWPPGRCRRSMFCEAAAARVENCA